MSIVFRSIFGRKIYVVSSSILFKKATRTTPAVGCLKRWIFDDRYLNLESLTREKEKLKAAILQRKSKISIELENVKMFTKKKARILVAGSESTEDMNRLIEIAQKFIEEEAFTDSEIRGFILQIIRLAYLTDQIDQVLKMFDSQVFQPYLNGTFSVLIVMNKLFQKKRYDEIIALFEKQIPFYSIDKSFSERSPEFFRQTIPYDQLSCVIASLMALNSRESFLKLKTISEILVKKKSNINRRSLARAFLLSINQGESEFALNLVHSTACSIDLRLNLEIIALCLLDRLTNAFVLTEQMFMVRWNEKFDHQGRFFPLVFKSMEQAIDRELNNEDYIKKYQYIRRKAHQLKRVSSLDLQEYCSIENNTSHNINSSPTQQQQPTESKQS